MTTRLILRVLLVMVPCTLLMAAPVRGQEPQDKPPDRPAPRSIPLPERFRQGVPHGAALDLRRRLLELDRLLSLGSLGRAEALIEELEVHSQLEQELLPRRIRLARLRGDNAEAVRLTEEALARNRRSPGLWRDLMEARTGLDDLDGARAAADSFIHYAPNRRSATVVSVELMLGSGHPHLAVALIDSLRPVLGEPRLLSRQRAVGLLATGDQAGAAEEVNAELMAFAYNYALLRTALLDGPYRPGEHGEFRDLQLLGATAHAAPPEATLLAIDLALAEADAAAAADLADRLLPTPTGRRALLRSSVTLGQELRLLEDRRQLRATVDYLLPVLADLSVTGTDLGSRRRAAELIPGVCSDALELRALDDDPRRAAARCDEMLDVVRRTLPASPQLHAARIQLALFTRDELGAPSQAARQLEGMLLDLDLPTEGVALVRLTLGECYFAAGDTARGRVVLTSLGRDQDHRQAAGHAHYHLARLDLAGRNYMTARDRFAVVALDNPGAPYANNALELGLAVAEELDNPTGGPVVLDHYAPTVYFELTARPDLRREALRSFVEAAVGLVDERETQHLLERGRWELAGMAVAAGDTTEALDLLDTITHRHAEGRYPAAALERTGTLLAASGRADEAKLALEQLLAQYPNYLFSDDVRDHLRSLP